MWCAVPCWRTKPKKRRDGGRVAWTKPHINYNLIPGVVHTGPGKVAGVGQTEELIKQAGKAYKVIRFPNKALGRACFHGFRWSCKKSSPAPTRMKFWRALAPAADMIAAGVKAMEYRASAEDVSRMSHAHRLTWKHSKRHVWRPTGRFTL